METLPVFRSGFISRGEKHAANARARRPAFRVTALAQLPRQPFASARKCRQRRISEWIARIREEARSAVRAAGGLR